MFEILLMCLVNVLFGVVTFLPIQTEVDTWGMNRVLNPGFNQDRCYIFAFCSNEYPVILLQNVLLSNLFTMIFFRQENQLKIDRLYLTF